jgi:hypothetical protein
MIRLVAVVAPGVKTHTLMAIGLMVAQTLRERVAAVCLVAAAVLELLVPVYGQHSPVQAAQSVLSGPV